MCRPLSARLMLSPAPDSILVPYLARKRKRPSTAKQRALFARTASRLQAPGDGADARRRANTSRTLFSPTPPRSRRTLSGRLRAVLTGPTHQWRCGRRFSCGSSGGSVFRVTCPLTIAGSG